MKYKTFSYLSLFLLSLCLLNKFPVHVNAGTYHSFDASSSLDHFDGSELIGTNNDISFYITWDQFYLYFGWKGDAFSTSENSTFLATDNNPGDSTGGSGALYGGVDFSGSSLPDYCLTLLSNGSAYSSDWDSDHWSSPGTDRSLYPKYIATNNTQIQKVRIPREDVSISDVNSDFAIWMWVSNNAENEIYSSFPTENPVGSSPTFTYCFCFNTSDPGRSPSTYGYSTNDATLVPEFPFPIIFPVVIFSSIILAILILYKKR